MIHSQLPGSEGDDRALGDVVDHSDCAGFCWYLLDGGQGCSVVPTELGVGPKNITGAAVEKFRYKSPNS